MKNLAAQIVIAFFIALCFQACHKDENAFPQNEQHDNPKIDSSVDFNGKTYSTWIKDESFYIGIYDINAQKQIAEIPIDIEGGLNRTADLRFGVTKDYTIKGCYILDITKNENNTILLLEYSEYIYGLGITEIIKLNNNEIIKRVKYTDGRGRPNKLINWYNNEIAAIADVRLSTYSTIDFYIYDNNLDLIYRAEHIYNYDFFCNSFPIGTYLGITLSDTNVYLYNIKTINYDYIWRYEYNVKPSVVTKWNAIVEDEIIKITVDLAYQDGNKETKSFKLKLSDGSLVED